MATSSKSNIEVTADTRKARKTMGDFFRDIENAGRRFNRVLNSLDPFDDLQRGASRSSAEMDDLRDAANRLDSGLDNLGDGNNLNDLNGDLDTTDQNLNDLQDTTRDVDRAINNATEEVEDFGDASVRETETAESSFGKLGDTVKKIGGILIAAFAVDKIIDFGTNLAETAGSAQAVKAQFSAVFGDMEGEAAKRLGAIAGEATILESRMKESFTKIASFAKTGGMDTADSLDLADRSMRAIADSAAFYDKSLEDTTESLQSFLKGNFENDAALGLSATETTRNAAANDLYGKSFNDLSESQKQLALLQMVEDANALSGALGQAARESDGWENVTGNMKRAWTDFKAVIGEPFLEVAVNGLKNMTGLLQNIDAEKIRDTIGGAFKFVAGTVDTAKDAIKPFYEFFKSFIDGLRGLMKDDGETGRGILRTLGFSEEMVMMMDGYAAKIGEFQHYVGNFIDGIKGLFQDDGQAGRDILASLGLSPDLIMQIDEWAMNLSAFRGNIKEVWDAISQIFQGNGGGGGQDILRKLGFSEDFISRVSTIVETFKTIGGVIKDVFIYTMPLVKSAVSAVVSFLVSHFSKIFEFWQENGPQFLKAVGNLFKGIMAVIKFVMPAVLGIIKMVWGNIKGVISGALDVIMGIVKVFSGLFTGDFAKMWEGLKQMFFGAVEFIWNFIQLTFYGKILGGAKAFILAFRSGFASLWAAVVALFKGNATAALNFLKSAWTAMSGATKTVFTSIWNFLKNTWNSIKSITTGFINGVKLVFTNGWNFVRTTTTNNFNTVWNFLKGIWTTIRTFLSNSVSGIFTKIRDTWTALKTNTTGAFRDIFNGIKGRFTDIVNAAKELPGRIGRGIGNMASKVKSGVTSVINTLARTLGKGVNGVIGGINWVLGKIGVDSTVPKWDVPQYAQGTKAHPGGLAIVGDGRGSNSGSELIQTPDGKMSLSPDTDTVVNLPKGSKVLSALKTKSLLSSLPRYANGIGDLWNKTKRGASHLWGKAKDAGKKVVSKAFDIFDYIKNPSKLLDVALSALGIEKPGGAGYVANMAKGAWNKVKSGAVNFVKGKLADFGGDGGPAPGFGRLFGKSSSYGWRTHPITGRRELHRGDDYGAAPGTRIPAQAAGRVIQAAYHALRGNYVRIKSGILDRIYQHNSRNLVGVGDMVRKGQAVGTVGSTGASTGPHLHYEVLKNGNAINPAGYFQGGIVKMKQLAWIAEKGMEAIIPLETNRAEGLDLWRRVGEHFGFDMATLLNQGTGQREIASPAISNVIKKIPYGKSDTTRTNEGNSFSQEVHLHSPRPLSPAENARRLKQIGREQALEWGFN